MSDKRSFLKSAGVVSAFTLLSRVFGVVRDTLTARVLGASGSIVADAFVWAFTIPNLFRRLFGEGALSAAFIPVFVEYLGKEDKEDAKALANIATTFMITVLSGIAVLGMLFCFAATNFFALPEKLALTLGFLEVMLPYLVFICLYALFAGILNSYKHFAMPAAGPAIFNVVLILVLLFAVPQGATLYDQATLIAFGVLLAGVVQMMAQVPIMRSRGLKFRLRFDWRHPGAMRVARALVPVVFGLAVFQINTIIDATLAEIYVVRGSDHGAVSVLYYANRLMQFPLGVFGIAIATAVFPTFAEYAARKDYRSMVETTNEALRVNFFIALPATVGLVVLGEQIVAFLFEYGAFTHESTLRTALAMSALTAGLFAYGGLQIITRTFYSLGDTKTPVKIGIGIVLLNIGLNFTLLNLFPELKEASLALATSLAAIANLFVCSFMLRSKIGPLGGKRITIAFIKVLAVSAVMGIACWGTLKAMTVYGTPGKLYDAILYLLPVKRMIIERGLYVLIPIATGLAVYLGIMYMFKVKEFKTLLHVYLPRKKHSAKNESGT